MKGTLLTGVFSAPPLPLILFQPHCIEYTTSFRLPGTVRYITQNCSTGERVLYDISAVLIVTCYYRITPNGEFVFLTLSAYIEVSSIYLNCMYYVSNCVACTVKEWFPASLFY